MLREEATGEMRIERSKNNHHHRRRHRSGHHRRKPGENRWSPHHRWGHVTEKQLPLWSWLKPFPNRSRTQRWGWEGFPGRGRFRFLGWPGSPQLGLIRSTGTECVEKIMFLEAAREGQELTWMKREWVFGDSTNMWDERWRKGGRGEERGKQ